MTSTTQGKGGLLSGPLDERTAPPVAAADAPQAPAPAFEHRVSMARVLGPFVAATALLALLSVAGFYALSGVRAYVGGESLWSKGRSVAVAQLRLYAVTGSAGAHARFTEALEVPLGDREAREALDRRPADLTAARDGFLRGGNHAGDVPAMVWMYRCCSGTPLMRDAVEAWVEGDRLIAELVALGARLSRRLDGRESLSAAERIDAMAQLDALESRLIAQERRFSASLGTASRAVVWLLCAVTLGLAALLAMAGVALGRRGLLRHQQAQQQLAQANQRWTLATASDGLGLFDWNLDSDEVFLDARAAAAYGFDFRAEGLRLLRSELRKLLHPDDRMPVRTALAQAVASGELFKQRYRIRRPSDGAERHLAVTGLLYRDAGVQQAARMLGVVRDVTDEVQNTQLALDKAAAERVARARIEFLSRLSHELRTPLNAVLGFSQLMLADASQPLAPAQRARVQHIGEAGEHLLRLVEDVLDITHIDSGNFSMSLRPMALQPVVDAALRLVDKERQSYDVQVVHGLPAQPLHVVADAQRLEQVFVNLFSNACKYNRRGGVLVIEHAEVGDQVTVSVRDEGEGLDAQELEQLFRPFKRLAPAASAPGTGLGLVVVKLLLEQMGGAIEVHSIKGRGTTFTVSLPATAAVPADVLPDEPSEQADKATRSWMTATRSARP